MENSNCSSYSGEQANGSVNERNDIGEKVARKIKETKDSKLTQGFAGFESSCSSKWPYSSKVQDDLQLLDHASDLVSPSGLR